jgi:hypothetical protein
LADAPWRTAIGIVDKGMILKVDSAVAAIKSGVEKVSFVDGRVPHSVMLEIFTDQGWVQKWGCDPRWNQSPMPVLIEKGTSTVFKFCQQVATILA